MIFFFFGGGVVRFSVVIVTQTKASPGEISNIYIYIGNGKSKHVKRHHQVGVTACRRQINMRCITQGGMFLVVFALQNVFLIGSLALEK